LTGSTLTKAGTWEDTSANATGTAGWWRITGTGPSNIDGSITGTGGGGDMELDDTSIVTGGTVTVSTVSIAVPAS